MDAGRRGQLSTEVILPRLGQGMESGTIVRWLKAEGDRVEAGEPLFELDTEKVTQEVEAVASGILLGIFAGEGEEIEVGRAIAVIGEAGEDYSTPAVPARAEEDARGEAHEASRPAPASAEEVAAAPADERKR